MKRLVQTSAGWIELQIGKQIRSAGGINVGVVRFDTDGWEVAEGWWNRKVEDERGSLSEVIARTAQIPPDEADRIASEALSEWRERGGESEQPARVIRAVLPIFGLAALGAMALLALAVWLLLKLF